MSWLLQAVFVLLILSVAPLSSLTRAEEAGTSHGCKGNSCCAGVPGKHGTNGIPGRPGPPGPSGPPGRNGLNGHPGPAGPKGEPGETGRRGRRGHAGEPGRNGTDGHPGWRGKSGPRGPRGAKGPPGEPGNPGAPGERGPPGKNGVIKNCQCGRNTPTQVFFLNSGYWISERYMLGFNNVRRARGTFHLKVLGPVTYVLHIGGDWVNNNDVTLKYRLHCTHRGRTVFLPNEKGHKIYKFREQSRLESETFTYVTTELNQTGRWHCHLQISKGYIRSFYRWDSQYGEISLAMW